MPCPVILRKVVLLFIVSVMVSMEVIVGAKNVSSSPSRPRVVNIGSMFTINSVIGQSTMPAIYAAVDEVNADPNVLKGTKLNLTVKDTNCSGFVGTVDGMVLNLKSFSGI